MKAKRTTPRIATTTRRGLAATESVAGDQLLNTKAAAQVVGLAPATLRQLRQRGEGPRCMRLGTTDQARVVYRRSDIERWIAGLHTVVDNRT